MLHNGAIPHVMERVSLSHYAERQAETRQPGHGDRRPKASCSDALVPQLPKPFEIGPGAGAANVQMAGLN